MVPEVRPGQWGQLLPEDLLARYSLWGHLHRLPPGGRSLPCLLLGLLAPVLLLPRLPPLAPWVPGFPEVLWRPGDQGLPEGLAAPGGRSLPEGRSLPGGRSPPEDLAVPEGLAAPEGRLLHGDLPLPEAPALPGGRSPPGDLSPPGGRSLHGDLSLPGGLAPLGGLALPVDRSLPGGRSPPEGRSLHRDQARLAAQALPGGLAARGNRQGQSLPGGQRDPALPEGLPAQAPLEDLPDRQARGSNNNHIPEACNHYHHQSYICPFDCDTFYSPPVAYSKCTARLSAAVHSRPLLPLYAYPSYRLPGQA